MNKFIEWFGRNRKTIGYSVGVLNLLAALNYALTGQLGMAVLWTVMGAFVIYDAYEFK